MMAYERIKPDQALGSRVHRILVRYDPVMAFFR